MVEGDKRVSALIREARRLGATHAKAIPARDVFIDERVRLKCTIPLCHNFGRHLMCPPNLISIDEFRRALKAYRLALLVQLESDVDSADRSRRRLDGKMASQLHEETSAHKTEKRLHAIINDLEAMAFKNGFYFAAGLIGSECLLCGQCVGQSGKEACRHPFQARPSMQAVGIDVIETSRKAGLPVMLSSRSKVRWTGLLLLH